MNKDLNYFHGQATQLLRKMNGISFDAYDLAVCMEEAYKLGYEDGVSSYYRDSGDL